MRTSSRQAPGLFEGDEFIILMTQCKVGSQRDGLMLDSAEELHKLSTQKVDTHGISPLHSSSNVYHGIPYVGMVKESGHMVRSALSSP